MINLSNYYTTTRKIDNFHRFEILLFDCYDCLEKKYRSSFRVFLAQQTVLRQYC